MPGGGAFYCPNPYKSEFSQTEINPFGKSKIEVLIQRRDHFIKKLKEPLDHPIPFPRDCNILNRGGWKMKVMTTELFTHSEAKKYN